MSTQRRSYETGHKPKCLVIVDDTAEWDRAVYYASRWAMRVGGGVVMLRIIEIEDQNQQWLGVADIMRAEAHEEANAALDRASGRANGIAAITPERVIREGDSTEQCSTSSTRTSISRCWCWRPIPARKARGRSSP